MKNEIKNLKASLEVVRDYAKEAENLVTQINKETENIRKEYDLTLPQIKDMIHEDMHVLKEFSNPKYPDTTRLTVCVGQENGLHFKAYILLSDEGEYKKGPAGNRLALGGVLAFEVLFNSFLSSTCAIFNMFFDFMVKAEAIKDRNSKNDCETNSDPNRNKKISYQPDEQSDSIKRT